MIRRKIMDWSDRQRLEDIERLLKKIWAKMSGESPYYNPYTEDAPYIPSRTAVRCAACGLEIQPGVDHVCPTGGGW
jgi:hypothetical protein